MIITIDKVLDSNTIKLIIDKIREEDFVSGEKTAGWHAKTVKNNYQLDSKADYNQELKELIKNQLLNNSLIQSACLPKVIHSILFSRYSKGMFYGRHTDNAIMGGRAFFRSDISFTLFLNPSASYVGGELVIEGVQKEESYKLDAGSIILYPSTTLHRVEPIIEGVRLVIVGWIQSLVRDPSQREILFELDTARRSLWAKEKRSTEFDLISKSYTNLLRLWAE